MMPRTALASALLGLIAFFSPGATAPQSNTPSAAKPLSVAPVAYFAAHCARCHGALGMNYADGFTKGKTDADLQQVLTDMATGPGGAPLKPDAIATQVAFHRAIDAQAPFIAWTDDKVQGAIRTLGGEVSGADSLTAQTGGQNLPVTVHDGNWKLTVDEHIPVGSIVVVAQTGKKRAALAFAKASFSHPLPEKP
jgi:mono/diheme cytochrome c family protein